MFFSNPLVERLDVVKHGKEISAQNLWPFMISSKIENMNVAAVYNCIEGRYELETPNGISMSIVPSPVSNKDGSSVSVYMINAVENTLEIHGSIKTNKDFENIISGIVKSITALSNKAHKMVKKNEMSVLKNIVKERIMSKNFNFDDFVTIEQNKAYSEAFFELIESGQIYGFEYFSKKRKISFDQLPTNRFINPLGYCDLTNISMRSTAMKDLDQVLANRVDRLSCDRLSESASWSKYDSERKVQICTNDYVMSEFPVDAGDQSFYINSKKERVSDILDNRSLKKFESAFSPFSKPVTTLSGRLAMLNNLVTVLAKGCFLTKYVDCGGIKHGVMTALEFDGHYCLVDSKSAYYALREAIYFIEENEQFEIKLYKDRLILTTSHGKRFALSSKLITEEQSQNIEFMREHFCLYSPVNVLYVMTQFRKFEAMEEMRPEIKKVRVLSKIEAYIERNKQLSQNENDDFSTPMMPVYSDNQMSLSI
jgi:hypothetical protein